MIKSMTGFASAAATAGNIAVTVEMRTYNSRNLDLSLRVSPGDTGLEERIRALLSGRLVRGRVEVKIQVETTVDDAARVDVDMTRARALVAVLKRLQADLGLDGAPSLELLMSCGGILKNATPETDVERVWPTLEACLTQALGECDAMRGREGRHLAQDLDARLDWIEGALKEIAGNAAGLTAIYQERLRERIATLIQGQGLVEIDHARLAQEAAFLAERSDISEELVRAESHIRQFRGIMAAPEAGGRKMNFLLQELNREFNTMGSKIGSADVAHAVVDVKSELEKIREQVQNVE
jgi:uncharacterized protein (TIGR00255 family)